MRRLIWAFAGRTYYIAGNHVSRLTLFLWKISLEIRKKIPIIGINIHLQIQAKITAARLLEKFLFNIRYQIPA